jgi:tripartite-type tricarboxylate transporter receptor subunit TctC
VLGRLGSELRAIMAEPAIVAECARRGIVPLASGPPEELPQFVRAEITHWGKVVERAGAGQQ